MQIMFPGANHKRTRLKEFDYSSSNSYFLTVCAQDLECVFGEIRNGIMGLSEIGNTVAFYLQRIPELRSEVILDEFIVMPNHLHCILTIGKNKKKEVTFNKFGKPVTGSISMIINQFKGAVKKWCDQNGFSQFEWHPGFHDKLIRNRAAFQNMVRYIRNNPANWK